MISLLAALVGCVPAYTVSQFRTDSVNPALIELRARDAFRNSDHLTLSVETRASCQQKPDPDLGLSCIRRTRCCEYASQAS